MSSGFSEGETQDLKDNVKVMNNDRVSRVCSARFEGLSLYHREWLDLDNQRSLHRLAFDNYFQNMDILIASATGSPAFFQNQNGPRYSRFLTINGQDYPEMGQTFWSGYFGVVGLPSVVGPIGHVGNLPAGYQGITGHGDAISPPLPLRKLSKGNLAGSPRHRYAFESGTTLCAGRTRSKIVHSISTDVRPAASYISTGDPWSIKTSGNVIVRILIPLSNWPDAAR